MSTPQSYNKVDSASPLNAKDSAVKANIQALADLFPAAVQEGVVDFDALTRILGGKTEPQPERFGLNWCGKAAAHAGALIDSAGTLRPCREESKDWDTTKNLYIEGDNLEVLKLLRNSYRGKVKMIYIDPPYNTGKDFVYKDNFHDSIKNYQQITGQQNELKENTETSGRYHTDWLNMMYPRLMLARELLCDDGVILLHIDEHEIASLELICKEVLGENNYLGTIIWDKKNPKGEVAGVAYQHESILVFCKNRLEFTSKNQFLKEKENAAEMLTVVNGLIKKNGGMSDAVREGYIEWLKQHKDKLSGGEKAYKYIDENGQIYQPVSMAAPDKPETRSHRPLIHPVTGMECPVPEKGWRFTDSKMDELLALGRISFGRDENAQPRQKYFLSENMKESVSSLLYYGGADTALDLPFDNPKPVFVAKRLIACATKDDDVILDFFSGSATTAHAVMKLNAEDGGKRRFILVQLPEACEENSDAANAGYKNICEIGKERIRRAGEKVKEEAGEKSEGLDIGFRVYKLDSSNVYAWDPDTKDIEKSLEEAANHLKEERNAEDIMTELMLRFGIMLTNNVEKQECGDTGLEVYNIGCGRHFACLDERLAAHAEEVAHFILEWHKEENPGTHEEEAKDCQVFVVDKAFVGNDAAKKNFCAILSDYGIKQVNAF